METYYSAIANLGFAIAIGAFLVYFITQSVTKRLDGLEKSHDEMKEIMNETHITFKVLFNFLKNGKVNGD